MSTEVDLDKIKTGDRVVVEGPVYVGPYGDIFLDGDCYIRYSSGEPGDLKVLQHKSRFDEPLDIGALAYLPAYLDYAVRVVTGSPGARHWHRRFGPSGGGSEDGMYTWDELNTKLGGVASVVEGHENA